MAYWFDAIVENDKLYRKWKAAYHKAETSKAEQYEWEKQQVLTAFARYATSYIEVCRYRRNLKLYNAEKKKWYQGVE